MNRGIFLLRPGRGSAALLLHGLASSPWELGSLADFLDTNGWNVSAPLLLDLKEHEPDAFRRLSPDSWIDPANRALEELAQTHQQTIVIGTSMGGVIAPILAARHPEVTAVVLANPPFVYRNPLLRLALRFPFAWKGFPMTAPPGHEEEYFPYFPFRALQVLRDMSRTALASASGVRQPLLVFSSEPDRSVHPSGIRDFVDSAASGRKILRVLKLAPHSPFAPYHKNNALIFKEIRSFLSTRNS